MTATLTSTTTVAGAPTTDLDAVRDACDRALAMLRARDLDDRRWTPAGPLVGQAATHLRVALGLAAGGSSMDAPPVVRELDLAAAARRLLARDVEVVDERAAARFVHLAHQVVLAFT